MQTEVTISSYEDQLRAVYSDHGGHSAIEIYNGKERLFVFENKGKQEAAKVAKLLSQKLDMLSKSLS